MSGKEREVLKRLLLRAINKNQIVILSQLQNNGSTITSALTKISKTFKIPLSTLKLNAKILKNLNLITFGSSSAARPTEFGEFVIEIIGGDIPE